MKLSEIYKIIDEGFAPVALSHEYCKRYGAYDNSGILVDTGDEITGALCTLDLTGAAIDEAISLGANLIITHHPVIYGKISQVCNFDPLGKKLVRCIRNGISVLSMHLNLDLAQGGIDESLQQGICKATGTPSVEEEKLMQPLTVEGKNGPQAGAYGRSYAISPCTLASLKEGLSKEFSTERIACYGNMEREIKRVASFCGAGVDEGTIRFAAQSGADVIISSDYKHHLIGLALEEGLSVIALTHYASEEYGFEKFYERIRQTLELPCALHTDDIML